MNTHQIEQCSRFIIFYNTHLSYFCREISLFYKCTKPRDGSITFAIAVTTERSRASFIRLYTRCACVISRTSIAATALLLYFHQLMQTTCKAPGCVGAQIAGFRVAATSNICQRNRRDESYSVRKSVSRTPYMHVEFSYRARADIYYN